MQLGARRGTSRPPQTHLVLLDEQLDRGQVLAVVGGDGQGSALLHPQLRGQKRGEDNSRTPPGGARGSPPPPATHDLVLQVPVELVLLLGGQQLAAALAEGLAQPQELLLHRAHLALHLGRAGVLAAQGLRLRPDRLHLLLPHGRLLLQHLSGVRGEWQRLGVPQQPRTASFGCPDPCTHPCAPVPRVSDPVCPKQNHKITE